MLKNEAIEAEFSVITLIEAWFTSWIDVINMWEIKLNHIVHWFKVALRLFKKIKYGYKKIIASILEWKFVQSNL